MPDSIRVNFEQLAQPLFADLPIRVEVRGAFSRRGGAGLEARVGPQALQAVTFHADGSGFVGYLATKPAAGDELVLQRGPFLVDTGARFGGATAAAHEVIGTEQAVEPEPELVSDTFTPPEWLTRPQQRGRGKPAEAHSLAAPAAFQFKPTADQTDFGPKLRKAWHDVMSARFDAEIAVATRLIATKLGVSTTVAAAHVRFFNPATRPASVTLTDKNVRWRAMPTSFGKASPTIYKRVDEPDSSGVRIQDEYCEWTVFRNSAKKIVRVVFTSEPREYYDFLHDPGVAGLKAFAQKMLVRLYREKCSDNSVTLADLETTTGAYNPFNKWNARHCVHLHQPNNTLGAQVDIGARAAIVWSNAGAIVTNVKSLIMCDGFGDPSRQSDPAIGDAVNTFARDNRFVTLQNPVGLYMTSLDTSGWKTPDGTDAQSFWKVLRGSAGSSPANAMIVRAQFEVPAKKGYTVSDITIGGVPIDFGAQIAEHLEVRLGASVGPKDQAPDGTVTKTPTPCPC
ncbi:hypothetical protein BH11MYX4_BH11MYX4_35550 [soil metagenome]